MRSLAAYGVAIGIIRNSKYDPKFAQMVAKKYAKLLRKTGNLPKAQLIEVEFNVADDIHALQAAPLRESR